MNVILDGFSEIAKRQIYRGIDKWKKDFPNCVKVINLITTTRYSDEYENLDFREMIAFPCLDCLWKENIIIDHRLYEIGVYVYDNNLENEIYATLVKATIHVLYYKEYRHKYLQSLKLPIVEFSKFIDSDIIPYEKEYVNKFVKSDEDITFVKMALGSVGMNTATKLDQLINLIPMIIQSYLSELDETKRTYKEFKNILPPNMTYEEFIEKKSDQFLKSYFSFMKNIYEQVKLDLNSVNISRYIFECKTSFLIGSVIK